jgi:hypothetical protein
MLHKEYDRKSSVEKKNLWSWVSRGRRQNELIGGKLPVVKVTLTLTLTLRVAVVRSEKLVAETGGSSGTQRKGNVHRWSCYQATATEDWEDFLCAVVTVIYGVYNSVRLSQLFVVTLCNCLLNPITPIQTPSTVTHMKILMGYSYTSRWALFTFLS